MGNNLGKTITVNPEISKRIDCCLDELDNLDDTTKDIPVEEENVASPTKSEDLKTLFPYLKNTNTESLVLWDFLWALLRDQNYQKTVTWVSFPHLKFSIVNPSMLANLFGQVKQNPSMDWSKIIMILDLYLRKNRIISVPTEEHEFTYCIVPKAEITELVSKNATNKDIHVTVKSMDSCLDELDTRDDTTKDIPVAAEKVDNNLFKQDTQDDSTKNILETSGNMDSHLDELVTQDVSSKENLVAAEIMKSMDNSLDELQFAESMNCSLDEQSTRDDVIKDISEDPESMDSCLNELDTLDNTIKDILEDLEC